MYVSQRCDKQVYVSQRRDTDGAGESCATLDKSYLVGIQNADDENNAGGDDEDG